MQTRALRLRQGWLQAIGVIVIELIALYSSNNHINFFGSTIGINPQRGVSFIIASLAVVVVVVVAENEQLDKALGLRP